MIVFRCNLVLFAISCILIVSALCQGGYLIVYSLTDLGDLPGGDDYSEAYGINEDGDVVGESESDSGTHAFFWTPSGGMQDIGYLPTHNASTAYSVNNSDQVVGRSMYESGGGSVSASHAFLWNPSSGLQDLGDLPGGQDWSIAYDINENGEVVGKSHGETYDGFFSQASRAFIWSQGNGMQDLGDLPSRSDTSTALGINNQRQIAGQYDSTEVPPPGKAVMWTDSLELIPIDPDPTNNELSLANDINYNGDVVGERKMGTYTHAFMWSNSGGFVDLGTLLDMVVSSASAINDHRRIVGGSQGEAIIWTPDEGMHNLNTLLDETGTGWQLRIATDINNAGQIVGYGEKDGVRHGFLLSPSGVINTYSLTIQTEPSGVSTVNPPIGEHTYHDGDNVQLQADRYVNCPDVYVFDHWEGEGIADVNSPITTIALFGDQTITAVFSDDRQCGDECHSDAEIGDLNHDCIINIDDFALLATHWLDCTQPICD